LASRFIDPKLRAKTNTFMASKSKIDNRQMYVWNQKMSKDKKYCGRPMTALERERMIGYPDGYVSNAGGSFTNVNVVFSIDYQG